MPTEMITLKDSWEKGTELASGGFGRIYGTKAKDG